MYPILLDISQRKLVVIGAGRIATRKVQSILAGGGTATVIAPQASSELLTLAAAGQITFLARGYEAGDTTGFDFVFICTDDPEVNRQVLQDTDRLQWINDTTCKSNSNCYSPAVVRTTDLTYTVSSQDQDPRKTKAAKCDLQAWLAGCEE